MIFHKTSLQALFRTQIFTVAHKFFFLKLTSVEWQNNKKKLLMSLHLKHSYYHAKLSKTICSHRQRYCYDCTSIECGVMAKHIYNLIADDRLSIRDGQTIEHFKIPAMPLLQMHFTVLLIVVWIYSQGII